MAFYTYVHVQIRVHNISLPHAIYGCHIETKWMQPPRKEKGYLSVNDNERETASSK